MLLSDYKAATLKMQKALIAMKFVNKGLRNNPDQLFPIKLSDRLDIAINFLTEDEE